ncbi:UNVERIFIED_CONTAM: hypothetical protein NCL1_07465 [Trichonephila clavipes]
MVSCLSAASMPQPLSGLAVASTRGAGLGRDFCRSWPDTSSPEFPTHGASPHELVAAAVGPPFQDQARRGAADQGRSQRRWRGRPAFGVPHRPRPRGVLLGLPPSRPQDPGTSAGPARSHAQPPDPQRRGGQRRAQPGQPCRRNAVRRRASAGRGHAVRYRQHRAGGLPGARSGQSAVRPHRRVRHARLVPRARAPAPARRPGRGRAPRYPDLRGQCPQPAPAQHAGDVHGRGRHAHDRSHAGRVGEIPVDGADLPGAGKVQHLPGRAVVLPPGGGRAGPDRARCRALGAAPAVLPHGGRGRHLLRHRRSGGRGGDRHPRPARAGGAAGTHRRSRQGLADPRAPAVRGCPARHHGRALREGPGRCLHAPPRCPHGRGVPAQGPDRRCQRRCAGNPGPGQAAGARQGLPAPQQGGHRGRGLSLPGRAARCPGAQCPRLLPARARCAQPSPADPAGPARAAVGAGHEPV